MLTTSGAGPKCSICAGGPLSLAPSPVGDAQHRLYGVTLRINPFKKGTVPFFVSGAVVRAVRVRCLLRSGSSSRRRSAG